MSETIGTIQIGDYRLVATADVALELWFPGMDVPAVRIEEEAMTPTQLHIYEIIAESKTP